MSLKSVQKRMGIVFVFIMISLSPALAANNPTFVIGGGVGSYNFDDENLKSVSNILYGSKFIEWYVFDDIGIGLRDQQFYKTNSSASDEDFLMVNVNLTITWRFWAVSSNLSMAAYAGYGPGYVSYSNEDAQIDITETTNTTSGGIFLDWGGERWGARLTIHRVSADFDYEDGLNSGTISGSGSSVDVGIRLAF